MPRFQKHFTLEDALAELPFVRAAFERIEQIRSDLGLSAEAMEDLTRTSSGNGGGKKSAEYLERILSRDAVLAGLADRGIILKDITAGLVDFPHKREGNEVFQCYMASEETIGYYHGLDSGFAGRKPL